jgi:hypothetical protein
MVSTRQHNMSYSKGEYVQLIPVVWILNHIERTMAPTPTILLPPDVILWVYIKDNAYHDNPHNMELKTNISNITADITLMLLQAVSVNMLHHAQLRSLFRKFVD